MLTSITSTTRVPGETSVTRHLGVPFRWLGHLWRTNAPLTATGLAMAVLLPLTLAGL